MNSELLSVEGLEDQVRTLTVAETPAEVFKILLESARLAAPRATVFLVRQGQIKGWGAVGYPPDASRRQREYVGPVAGGWLGDVIQSEPPLHSADAASVFPGFGQPAPAECMGMAVRVKGRAIALLAAERLDGEHPWYPPVMAILVRVAQLRLDLDLTRRKLAGAAPTPPVPVRPATKPPAVAEGEGPSSDTANATARPEPDVQVETVSATPDTAAEVADVAPSTQEIEAATDDPQLESARRYARLVATDIRLYNEEAVVLGRRNGDLSERLHDSLLRGKETFLRRHGDLGATGVSILHDAYVQVLAGGEAHLVPSSLLD